MSKRFLFVIVICLAVAVVAWFGFGKKTIGQFAQASDSVVGAGGAGAHAPMASAVSFVPIVVSSIEVTQSLPGRITPSRQSQIRPQVDGIITERFFEEGAFVEQGQQLYQIDDSRYKAKVASANADLKSARATVKSIKAKEERYKELVQIDAVSKQEYDDVKAQYDQATAGIAVAQAALDLAKVDLDYTKVYAPISGQIGRSLVTEGTLVTANQSQVLAVITQLDPVYVDMKQSGSEAMSLRQQAVNDEAIAVQLSVGEDNVIEYPHEGKLKFSEVTIDETTGSTTLRAVVPNPDGFLLPGLFVRASLKLGQKPAILVPQRATIRSPDGSLMTWVIDGDQKAQPRPIVVGNAYKDQWIVASGLSVGDKVIVEGYQKIGPGAPVNATPWQNNSIAQPPAPKAEKTEELKLMTDPSTETAAEKPAAELEIQEDVAPVVEVDKTETAPALEETSSEVTPEAIQ